MTVPPKLGATGGLFRAVRFGSNPDNPCLESEQANASIVFSH